MDEPFQDIDVTCDDGIAILTLKRPQRLNALGVRMVDELEAALANVEAEGQARVVIITGTGEQAFSAGVDLKERREMNADQRWAHNRAFNEVIARLARLQVPTIAAINGLALGGGFELTLACDFRIAADHAQFALPEVGLGIIPGAGGTQRLPRLIGPTKAKELILTGRRVPADEGLRIGILSEVVSKDELLTTTKAFAGLIMRNSPLAVAHAKAAIDIAMETSLEQGLRYETAAIRATLAAEDYQIGLAAFAEKRTPQFPPLTTRRVV